MILNSGKTEPTIVDVTTTGVVLIVAVIIFHGNVATTASSWRGSW